MSHAYRAVGWNRQKRVYDLLLVGGVVAYLTVFAVANLVLRPEVTAETLLIRGFGTCAVLLLHVVLSIGPLCRLDPRFLPLLYNRRHLGVTMFLAALAHAAISIVQFHTLGDLNPLVSVLVSNGRYESLAWFPFQPLGLAALVILFLMAATSHDFWLANLTAPAWKALHMSVYAAYGLVVLHVALGVLQAERSPVLATLVALGFIWVVGLHVAAGRRERLLDTEPRRTADEDGFVPVCMVERIPENRARVVTVSGERVAVFRHAGGISALSNVCQHQNGPLGEGRIIDGCVTCPWHGFQYSPDAGASPPPFTEKVPTFRVRVEGDQVFVHPTPNPPGTRVEPAPCGPGRESGSDLYVGYIARAPKWVRRFVRPWLVASVTAGLVVAVLSSAFQNRFAPSVYEYQSFRTFSGTLMASPYPMLLVDRVGEPLGAETVSVYPLTVFGKVDADEAVASFSGRRVELEGELIYRDGQTMLQLSDSPPRAIGESAEDQRLELVGDITVTGEIVDSKCYLGVMKPGRDKPHRACASLCIRGGVPPMLVVDEIGGGRRHYILMSGDGRANGRDLLDLVAELVRVTGEMYRLGDTHFIAADRESFERLR